MSYASLPNLLKNYVPFDDMETFQLKQIRQFLAETSNPYSRSNILGHIVAEAWIVNPKRDHVVLVEHKIHKHWVTPGGHCDGNPDVFAQAVREAREETGLTDIRPLLQGNIFDMYVSYVPSRKKIPGIEPTHLHFDICFSFEANENAPLRISKESTQLAWIPIKRLSDKSFHPGHYRRSRKTAYLQGINEV